jgi:hypothetical protein
MNKLKLYKATTIVLAIMLVVTIVYAAVLLRQRTVTFHGRINFVGDFMLYQDQACTVPLTDFDWQEVYRPSNNNMWAYLKIADGSDPMKFVWNVTGLPSGMEFTVSWKLSQYDTAQGWNENEFTTFGGHNYGGCVIILGVHLAVYENAGAGDFTFVWNVYGFSNEA